MCDSRLVQAKRHCFLSQGGIEGHHCCMNNQLGIVKPQLWVHTDHDFMKLEILSHESSLSPIVLSTDHCHMDYQYISQLYINSQCINVLTNPCIVYATYKICMYNTDTEQCDLGSFCVILVRCTSTYKGS